ncbi:MAG: Asp-tRNA(Asn)/Glu-tRNA(Gln) amidotransferase subunit GatC [Flavobacteriales bacterium]|nr:Asp-tRNA(Asn)/Glu-tRNA(Gln) amidotransferase subunit GatC [Flavobacteriales bacterium]
MKVDYALIDKLAQLARLQFEGEEKAQIKADLERLLGFVETLETIDTQGVAPLIYLNDEESRIRPDNSRTDITKEDALKNAPSRDSDYFKVPRVLSKGEE